MARPSKPFKHLTVYLKTNTCFLSAMRNSIFLLFLFSALVSNAQYLNTKSYGRYDSIKVSAFGQEFRFPWAGGLNTPQFSEGDFNGDGIKDLFVFDRDGEVVRTFLNGGTPGQIDYNYEPSYETAFPIMWDYAILYDYNKDGKSDVFTSFNGDFKVYDNKSSGNTPADASYQLKRFKSPFDSTQKVDFLSHKLFLSANNFLYTNVFNGNDDYPGLVDIDDDGDMDILAFGLNSNSVGFYKNISQETYGVPDSLDFRFITGCWGHFAEDNFSFKLYFGSCKNSGKSVTHERPITFSTGSRHAGSTILIHDFDANGLKDIVLGDISYNRVLLAFNNGSKADANMNAQDTAFPRYDKFVDVQSFPATFYLDVDNDSLKDFIAAPNGVELFSNINQVHLYKNTRQNNLPNLNFQGNDFLVEDMIDLGSDAHPLIIDIDGDSLKDIIAGSRGVFSTIGVYESRIVYYKNVGTPTNPSYQLVTRDFLPLPNGADTGLYPTAGDLDNDGDLDLIMGTERGNLYYYENVASAPGDSCEFVLTNTGFSSTIFGKSLRPFLYDVNGDGKLDIICGDQTAELTYYENTGTTTNPNFSLSASTVGFGGIASKDLQGNGYLSPFMARLDTNGAYDINGKEYLFVGTGNGYLYIISDIDAANRTVSAILDSFYVYARNVSITGNDLTGDEKMDIVFGHRTGGLSVLLKDGGNIIVQPPKEDPKDTISVKESAVDTKSIQVFPNPTNNTFSVQGLSKDQPSIGILYNARGVEQWKKALKEDELYSLEEYSNGVYFLRVSSADKSSTIKIVKH